MNRRNFLGLFGAGVAGLALDQAIPFNRVWSFPKEIVIAQPATVRFIRAWDPVRALMINRMDVLYGFVPDFPTIDVKIGEQITVPRESLVGGAVELLREKYNVPSLRSLEPLSEHLGRRSVSDPEIRGFWYDEPPHGFAGLIKSDSPSPS